MLPGSLSRLPAFANSALASGDVEAFYHSVTAAFEQAARAAGHSDRHYRIAGQVVRLRFAGHALIPHLTPAFAHLALAAPAEPDFTVHLWETASTGVEPPPPAWPYEHFHPEGVLQPFGNETVQAIFQLGTNTLNVLNSSQGKGYYWVRSAAQLPTYEQGAPLRWLLHLWLRRHGILTVHAGAVGTPDGGVLLAGRGGSGKSNTALSALATDLLYAADDYCLVQAEPAATIHSIYSTGKAHVTDLARLPFLAGRASNGHALEKEKALFYLHEHFPHKLVRGFPARAVLVPRVTGQPHTRAHLTTPAAGMAALTPSTISQLPGVQAEDVRVLVQFFRRVPSYLVELGTERAEVMGVVTELVTRLNAGERPARVPG